ncbi:MAG: SPOR domain-containing protein [Deltaproteobacteria bacterium]|nr:SPOR domain-containing protein [Deltaproteobacteria bacterium]
MRPKSQSLLILSALSILFCSQVFGQEVKIEIASGLYITTFETPKGSIKVYLPDGLAAGDTISGTVILEPEGGTEEQNSRNRNELSGYFIELEKEKIPLTQIKLKWTIPSTLTGGATFLIIRDKNGNEMSRAVVPVRANTTIIRQPINPSPWEYECPMVGRAGKPIQIQGPFDGNFGTTNLRIGGKEARLIAESPRELVFESPKDVVGSTQIELKEGVVIVKRNFNNLRVVKIGEEAPTFPTAKQPIKAETEREATKLLAEQTPVPIKQKEIKVESEIAGIKEEEIPTVYYLEKSTGSEAGKEETTQKNVALAPIGQKTPTPIDQRSALEPVEVKEKKNSPLPPQQQIKLDDAKKESKEEVQVKHNLVPPKQLKEQLEPKIPATKEQTAIKSPYSDEQTNKMAEKEEHIKKDLSPAINIEEKPSIAQQETKTERGKTEKKESPKEEFFSEQTPVPTKQITAKTAPKARFIEKQASISHLTKDSIKGEPKKEEATSKDIASVAPIESDGIYTIQVASYKKENDAKDFAEDLKSKGYPVFIIQGKVPGRGIWYRVRVGKFKTVKEAKLGASDLKKQEKEIQSFLITENN